MKPDYKHIDEAKVVIGEWLDAGIEPADIPAMVTETIPSKWLLPTNRAYIAKVFGMAQAEAMEERRK